MEKCGTAIQATDNIIKCTRFIFWIYKATDTHSEYVILIDFPRQQWLCERASVLRYTYSACLVTFRAYAIYIDINVVLEHSKLKFTYIYIYIYIRGGADKSLARSGRKKATATKLRIYSTYSPRSSIHFLARCSNFCKPLKKKIRRLSVQPGLRGSNDLCVVRKMATFQSFSSVQGTTRW